MFPHQIANAPVQLRPMTPPMGYHFTTGAPGMTVTSSTPAAPAPRLTASIPQPRAQTLWDEDCELGSEACKRPNFEWHNHGLAVWTRGEDGQPVRVFFPLHQVDMVFQRETAKVGCPMDPTVGDYSVGGFFKKLGRGLKKFHNVVTFKGLRKKIGRGIRKTLNKSKFGRGLVKAANKIHSVAQKVKKVGVKIIRSKPFRAALAVAGTAFPVIAPGVAALEAAQQIADRVEKAKRIAQRVAQGLENPRRAAGIIAEGARAAGIAGQAFDSARAGHRDGMEMMGAIRHLAERGTAHPVGRIASAAVRASPLTAKARRRARVLRRRRRAHARA
jgi:hypothetical protein